MESKYLRRVFIKLLLVVTMATVAGCGSDGTPIAMVGPGTTPVPPPAEIEDASAVSTDDIGLGNGDDAGTVDIEPANGPVSSVSLPLNGSADFGRFSSSRLLYRVQGRTFIYDAIVSDNVDTALISFIFGPSFGFFGTSDSALVTLAPSETFPAPIVEVVEAIPGSHLDECSTGIECTVDLQVNALYGDVKAPYMAYVIYREVSPNVTAFTPVILGVEGSDATISVTLFSTHSEQTQVPPGSKYEFQTVITTKALTINDVVEAPEDLPGVVFISEALQINVE